MTASFQGLKVLSFESRQAKEMEALIAHLGGKPCSAPSMQEVPLSEAKEAFSFAEKLMAGKVDVVIFMTGVGTKMLTEAVTKKFPFQSFVSALKKTTIVARGPKPVAALRKMKLKPAVEVPEPNTWKDILTTLDSTLPLQGKQVFVQEYGVANEAFVKALKERGACVHSVPIYRWALPENLEPLKRAIEEIIAGKTQIALFTSAQQVRHLFQVGREEKKEKELLEGFKKVVIGSIGPTTSEALQAAGLVPDYEPDRPKMAHLVKEVARLSKKLLEKKRAAFAQNINTNSWRRQDMRWPEKASKDSVFLKACRKEPTPYTPIWLMRQAGRYMRFYRELRERFSFLELCKNPEASAEITLKAAEVLDVDAAIIFADILLVLELLNIPFHFSKSDGPVIEKPLRSIKRIESLESEDASKLQFVYEAMKMVRRALHPDCALIGFAGAPFTLASYIIEGGASRHFRFTKELMQSYPQSWHKLMEKLGKVTADYLKNQIISGAEAVQIFDSWVGCLSPDDYRDFVLPHMKKLVAALPDVPVILFGTGTASLLSYFRETGASVIGLDWCVDLKKSWSEIGFDRAIQGNLDPAVLFAPPHTIRKQVAAILEKAEGRPGHIFNLGHGIPPAAPVEHVLYLVDCVHELSRK